MYGAKLVDLKPCYEPEDKYYLCSVMISDVPY